MSESVPAAEGLLFWFRQDLRLHDQPAVLRALERALQLDTWLVPVVVDDPRQQADTRWGFRRSSDQRHSWWLEAVADLAWRLRALGVELAVLSGESTTVLPAFCASIDVTRVYCEAIAAPEEQAETESLRRAGLDVHTLWQSSLLDPDCLPFAIAGLPRQFTAFRQSVEKHGQGGCEPLAAPASWTARPVPQTVVERIASMSIRTGADHPVVPDARSSFPRGPGAFHGGERSALAHLERYCARSLPHTYKQTRNGLIGQDYSSKLSPWLATGALSARQAWACIRAFEAEQGANESTYWLWFELLWRDYFRFLMLQQGRRLFGASGLGNLPAPSHHAEAFERWRAGRTGQAFVDAGMRELAATGFLSNRMRQIVASYLVNDLGCDWRAGAAWFEHCLIDHDVSSNHGNWLYISGRGTDPRGGRRFDPQKQARDHDPEAAYRQLWGTAP